jgi:hypothetical protein
LKLHFSEDAKIWYLPSQASAVGRRGTGRSFAMIFKLVLKCLLVTAWQWAAAFKLPVSRASFSEAAKGFSLILFYREKFPRFSPGLFLQRIFSDPFIHCQAPRWTDL